MRWIVVAGVTSELEACRLQQLATIDDLRRELNTVKQRAAQLEQLKQTTESNLHQQFSEQTQKCLALQQVR